MGKKVFSVIVVILVVALIGGIYYFSNNTSDHNMQNQNENNEQRVNEIANQANDQNAGNNDTEEENNQQESNILIAYYSYSGNTESFANVIREETGGDLFQIERAQSYSDLYTEAKEEIDNNERPEIAEMPANVESYDTIFIGYPIWWDRTPAMINTFLENIDLSGKTVIPFCTSSSDGIDGSMTDIRESARDATILDGLRISGGSAESNRSEIQNWLTDLGF